MTWLKLAGMLLMISISCYAQGSQESCLLLLLDFEDRSGTENPLLADSNDTIAFMLSRQTGPVRMRVVSTEDRNALVTRAAAMQPDLDLLERGLLVAEWVNANALITGSYDKQGEQWTLEVQVYHRREDRKIRQDIRIQGNSLYQLLDEFPAQLLQQFTDATHVELTTESWKAYEEYRKGHQQFEYYNALGALEHYNAAIELDPTLALAYAEKSNAHATIGQRKQATAALQAAQKWLSKASPLEQLAVRALAFTWDSERNEPAELFGLWDLYNVKHLPSPSFAWTAPLVLAPEGVWDEPLIHQLVAFAYMQEGKRDKAEQHHERWFRAIQPSLRAHSEDARFLHQTAVYCAGIGQYVDEAIAMELRAIELNSEANWREERYILSRLYELKGDIEQSLDWAKKHIQHWPDPRSFPAEETLSLALEGASFAIPGCHTYAWDHIAASMHEGRLSPERLLSWCEDVLSTPELAQPFRIRTQYLIAEAYDMMNDRAKMESVLTAIGAPREGDWMVLGPLDASELSLSSGPQLFAKLFADLSTTYSGIFDQEMKWQSWEDEQPLDGLLNIWGVFNKRYYGKWLGFNFPVPSVVYGCIYVKVPTAIEVQIRTGSAIIKVWINDNVSPVVDVNTFRAPILDQDLNNVSLSAGLNRFLVEMVSSNSMAFYFRITDHYGNAVPGLEFVSANEVLSSH